MADFRPVSSRDDEGRKGHHKGDGTQPRTHLPRARRNGLPPFIPYVYRGTGEDQPDELRIDRKEAAAASLEHRCRHNTAKRQEAKCRRDDVERQALRCPGEAQPET